MSLLALWTVCAILSMAALGLAILSEQRLVERPAGIEWVQPLAGAVAVQALAIAAAYAAGAM